MEDDALHTNMSVIGLEFTPTTCEPFRHWSLTLFVASLRRQGLQWCDIYWLLWVAANFLKTDDEVLLSADCESR